MTPLGRPIPLVAETGGQNALVVDSSALAEQVVGDVIASAFDSAGQRCSALRILCLQGDVAERTLAMLRGAMQELEDGNPDRLSADIGPVITQGAKDGIEAHVEAMGSRGHAVTRLPLGEGTRHGTFVAPTLIEIGRIADVEREVFGPVLHVLRFRREELDRLVDDINGSGYGLTFGLHTRIDETIARVLARIEAGNVYVNRNVIGAVVGVQPFGGSRLSGTGPKAGGPLYLARLLAETPLSALQGLGSAGAAPPAVRAYLDWLREEGREEAAERCVGFMARSAFGSRTELPGPVGERNVYGLKARGGVAALSSSESGLLDQLGAILATGNTAIVEAGGPARELLGRLPATLAGAIAVQDDWTQAPDLRTVLFEGPAAAFVACHRRIAAREGAILGVQALTPEAKAAGADWDLDLLLEEVSVSTNTAAAGGNASLMSIG